MKIEPEKAMRFFKIIKGIGIIIKPIISNMQLPDESDCVFYDTAKKGGAILIIGNAKYYPIKSFIMTPFEFLNKLDMK